MYKEIKDKVSIVLCVACLYFNVAICQKHSLKDSTQVYINRLDWNSFGITNNYISSPFLREDAMKLINGYNTNRNIKLLQAIKSKQKTVVIHMILTKIYKQDAAKFEYKYHYSNDTIDCVNYNYNGLHWKVTYANNDITLGIEKDEIEKIKVYWSKIINRSKPRRPFN